jgi:hypothetical protein
MELVMHRIAPEKMEDWPTATVVVRTKRHSCRREVKQAGRAPKGSDAVLVAVRVGSRASRSMVFSLLVEMAVGDVEKVVLWSRWTVSWSKCFSVAIVL